MPNPNYDQPGAPQADAETPTLTQLDDALNGAIGHAAVQHHGESEVVLTWLRACLPALFAAPSGVSQDDQMNTVTAEAVERVEEEVGMGCGAWDMVDPKAIIAAAWKVRGRRAGVSQDDERPRDEDAADLFEERGRLREALFTLAHALDDETGWTDQCGFAFSRALLPLGHHRTESAAMSERPRDDAREELAVCNCAMSRGEGDMHHYNCNIVRSAALSSPPSAPSEPS